MRIIPILVDSIKLERLFINKFSPSNFLIFKNGCVYRELLFRSNKDRKDLFLPLSRSAYIGRVVHRMYELAIRGLIQSESDFAFLWEEEIAKVENQITSESQVFDFLLPLVDYVKKRQTMVAVNNILANKKTKRRKSESSISTELFINDVDFLKGRIDLLFETSNFIEIIDYKTGEVFDETGQGIKEEYSIQLKLYAILYQQSTKKEVTRISIVDLLGNKHQIPFRQEELNGLYDDLIHLAANISNDISNGNFESLVKCVVGECKYCSCKPICSYYWKSDISKLDENVLEGTLIGFKKGFEYKISIEIQVDNKSLYVNGLIGYEECELTLWKNKKLRIFNIIKNRNFSDYFSATKNTILYGLN